MGLTASTPLDFINGGGNDSNEENVDESLLAVTVALVASDNKNNNGSTDSESPPVEVVGVIYDVNSQASLSWLRQTIADDLDDVPPAFVFMSAPTGAPIGRRQEEKILVHTFVTKANGRNSSDTATYVYIAKRSSKLSRQNSSKLSLLAPPPPTAKHHGPRVSESFDPLTTTIRDPAFGSTIMILYTGGTIGMMPSPSGLRPDDSFPEFLQSNVLFHDPSFPVIDGVMTTPLSRYKKRSRFVLHTYQTLLDSSQMSYPDWIRIAHDIEANYDQFDAFIVLHGTDTMAYTSSALSFMFQNLQKTVLLTGSQIPISLPQSDGIDNLLGALAIAGHYTIPEVCVYFNHHLFRGNRTTKSNSEAFDAFTSPNFPALATVGTRVRMRWEYIRAAPHQNGKFEVCTTLSRNVTCARLFPGMSMDVLAKFFEPPVQGVVLQTYGAGNAPTTKSFLRIIKEAIDRGVVIVNVTQCARGTVSTAYETGAEMTKLGVVGGFDMTVEAAMSKLAYLLGLPNQTPADVRKLMQANLRGELSTPQQSDVQFSMQNSSFIEVVAKTLSSTMGAGASTFVAQALGPTVLLASAASGSVKDVRTMLEHGVRVDDVGYDGKTLCHAAVLHGRVDVLELALSYGANVNIRDLTGRRPVDYALLNWTENSHKIIDVLVANAPITPPDDIGELLCKAGSNGNIDLVKRCIYAKIDIVNIRDYDARTVLHLAASEGHYVLCQFLLRGGFKPDVADRWGHTPLIDAERHNHSNIVKLMRQHLAKATSSIAEDESKTVVNGDDIKKTETPPPSLSSGHDITRQPSVYLDMNDDQLPSNQVHSSYSLTDDEIV